MITSVQFREARALLRITVNDLAEMLEIGIATIKRMEVRDGIPSAHARTLDQISKALERAGVEFIGSLDDRLGVRLKEIG